MTHHVHAWLGRLTREAAASARSVLGVPVLQQAAGQTPDIVTEIVVALDWEGLGDGLRGAVETALRQAFAQAASEAAAALGTGVPGDTHAVAYARDRAAEMVGRKWVDGVLVDNLDARWVITDTVRDELRQIITAGLEQGYGPRQMAGAIEQAGAFAPWRAETIARTETQMALRAGSAESYRVAGVQHVQLIDGSYDPVCAARNGRVVTLAEFTAMTDHPNGSLDGVPLVSVPAGPAEGSAVAA